MASLIFNWKRVEAESRILKHSSEQRERQFLEPLKCLKIWECLSDDSWFTIASHLQVFMCRL